MDTANRAIRLTGKGTGFCHTVQFSRCERRHVGQLERSRTTQRGLAPTAYCSSQVRTVNLTSDEADEATPSDREHLAAQRLRQELGVGIVERLAVEPDPSPLNRPARLSVRRR